MCIRDSFKTAFTGIINSYARELGILKDKDANINRADVRNGMTAVVSVKHPDPRFEGQTKTKLDNQEMCIRDREAPSRMS